MLGIAEDMREDTLDAISDEICRKNRGIKSSSANKLARKIIEDRTTADRGIIDIVSGKSLLASLSTWSQEDYGVSLSVQNLINFLIPEEVPEEMKNTIEAIEKLRNF
jgi:hypothetical protein